MTYIPPALQGPAPAHVLTLTLTPCRDGDGYDVDARCDCAFPITGHMDPPARPLPAGTGRGFVWGGWGEDPEHAARYAVLAFDGHRESCARRFGVAALR